MLTKHTMYFTVLTATTKPQMPTNWGGSGWTTRTIAQHTGKKAYHIGHGWILGTKCRSVCIEW